MFVLMTPEARGPRCPPRAARGDGSADDLFFRTGYPTLPLVPGTALPDRRPRRHTARPAAHIKHNKVVHEQTFASRCSPRTFPLSRRRAITVKRSIRGHPRGRALRVHGSARRARTAAADPLTGPPIDLDEASYFLGREQLIPTGASGMGRWRESLFALLSRNAYSATTYFRIPPNRVVELGAQVEL